MTIRQIPQATDISVLRRTGLAPVVAFVFQGGGSLTAGQVGMLRALSERGITPDLVIGSSAGALNAFAFASDPTPAGLDRLEDLWLTLRRKQVAPVSAWNLFAATTGRTNALLSNSPLRRLLAGTLRVQQLGQTEIAVHLVATDIESGQPVVLSDGDAVLALLASSAFPGLYPPVKIGSRQLIDGSLSADVPVRQAEALGATVTYVLPAALEDDAQDRGPLYVAYRALRQIFDALARRDTAEARGQIFTLPAPRSRASSPVDLRDTSRLITEGHRLAYDWLADHTPASDLAAVAVAV